MPVGLAQADADSALVGVIDPKSVTPYSCRRDARGRRRFVGFCTMNIFPGPMQTTAILLSVLLPFLLLFYARISSIRGAGSRFRIGCATVAALFSIVCFALPGERYLDDILGGLFLLATAIMLYYVVWSLLAWGFTLTLLTSLAQASGPLTEEQWASVYMQGGGLSTFADNRLKLLLGSGMVVSSNGKIIATSKGIAVAHLAKFVRFATGLG